MKPIRQGKRVNSTENGDNKGNQIQPADNKQISTHKRTQPVEIPNTNLLQSRAISLSLTNQDSYCRGVAEIMKGHALNSIALVNQIFTSHGHSQFKIKKCDPINDPIEEIAFKYAKAYINIIKLKLRHFYYKQLSERKSFSMEIQTYRAPDSISNGLFSWLTLVNIFQKFFEYEAKRDIFLQFKATKSTSDIVLKEICPLIDETIIGLEKIRDEQYFPKFRSSIDPSLDLKSKFKMFYEYRGFNDESELLQTVQICTISINSDITPSSCIEQMVMNEVNNISCYASRIQITIDCLNKIKPLPKTVNNLKIMYQVLSDCFSFFKEDLAQFNALKKERPSKLCDDYFMIKDFLLQQIKKFAAQINQATIQNNAELEGKNNTSKQNNLTTSSIKPSSQNPQNKKTESIAVTSLKETETPLEPKSPIQLEVKKDENEKSPISTILESRATNNIPKEGSDANSDEETLDEEIKRLNELLGRLFAKNREQKRLQKEAKTKKPAIVEANKPTEQPTPENIIIKIGHVEFTFQKLYHSTFLTDVWGVIITNNSVELQILARYEQLLSNGIIGSGSITQLKGFPDIYEIGSSTMDSRLLGKKYNDEILSALLKFMSEADAIQLNVNLEKHGINDKASLVIFSAEAKKHEDINSVARKL